MATQRKRSAADTARPARGKRLPVEPESRFVTYSFNVDEIRRILIMVGATGVVVNPQRPRPIGIELTIEQSSG